MAIEPIKGFYVHDEVTDTNGVAQIALDAIEGVIQDDIAPAVTSWLDDHPEATTTVQDGAITKAKINTAFLPEIENAYVTPEMFGVSGTDADILEYAFNNLADGGVLMLNKDYTLDRVITLTRLSSRKRITIMPLSENAKINMNGYYITGTENGDTGNILFFGVQFNGASTGIFDGDKLVRLYFLGCNFTSTGSIVFSLSNRERAYFQSIHFLQCTFRHITDYLIKLPYDTATRLFDVSIRNSLIEWCDAGLISCNTWYGVTVSGNCIEGFTTTEPLFKGMRVSNGFTVTDNYFESLNTVYFDFSNYTYGNPFFFVFENNSIAESTVMSVFSMPPKNGGSGSVFKVSGNSFMTDASAANKVTVFDVSNTTEKLDKWVIIENQNFNSYMIWTNDTNNYIQSYSTIYTLLKSLEQTNGLVDMAPGSTKLITIYTTGNAITRSQLVIPITFPFIAPNTNYTYTVRNLAITGVTSNADVTLISQDGRFDSGMDLRYIDTTNNPFTANIPYSVRIRLYITFG